MISLCIQRDSWPRSFKLRCKFLFCDLFNILVATTALLFRVTIIYVIWTMEKCESFFYYPNEEWRWLWDVQSTPEWLGFSVAPRRTRPKLRQRNDRTSTHSAVPPRPRYHRELRLRCTLPPYIPLASWRWSDLRQRASICKFLRRCGRWRWNNCNDELKSTWVIDDIRITK